MRKNIKKKSQKKVVSTKIPTYMGLTAPNKKFLKELTLASEFTYGSDWLNAHINQLRKIGVKKAAKQVVS